MSCGGGDWLHKLFEVGRLLLSRCSNGPLLGCFLATVTMNSDETPPRSEYFVVGFTLDTKVWLGTSGVLRWLKNSHEINSSRQFSPLFSISLVSNFLAKFRRWRQTPVKLHLELMIASSASLWKPMSGCERPALVKKQSRNQLSVATFYFNLQCFSPSPVIHFLIFSGNGSNELRRDSTQN